MVKELGRVHHPEAHRGFEENPYFEKWLEPTRLVQKIPLYFISVNTNIKSNIYPKLIFKKLTSCIYSKHFGITSMNLFVLDI